MGFMRLFAGLGKLVAGQQLQPQAHTRKTLVLYTHIKDGLGLSDTVYSEAKKFEVYASAPYLWNIDIFSYEIDRGHEREDETAATRGNYAPRRWYADGYLARHISEYDALALLKPYLNTHNYASLEAYLKTDPFTLNTSRFAAARSRSELAG